MSRRWELFLRDMLEAARKIVRYIGSREAETFLADEMAYDATLRNLEILGAAAKAIPEEVRQRHPEVDWRGVAGLRDVLLLETVEILSDTELVKRLVEAEKEVAQGGGHSLEEVREGIRSGSGPTLHSG